MTTNALAKSVCFWQSQEDGMPEPAILISPATDVIVIEQEKQTIQLNYESLDEFIKCLRNAKRNRTL